MITTKAPTSVVTYPRSVANTCLANGQVVQIPSRHHGPNHNYLGVANTHTGGLGGIATGVRFNALAIIANISKSNGDSLIASAVTPTLAGTVRHSAHPINPCGGVRNVRYVSGIVSVSRSPVNHAPHSGPTACVNL